MNWSAEIADAAQRIQPYIRRTPVFEARLPGIDRPVELKLEHLQHTGSFKARGAFNGLLSQAVPAAGVVAASGGNHGAAVAHAATVLGHKARIFVPELAGPAKIALVERSGGALTIVPGAYDNALAAARLWQAETGALQVHAFDQPSTVAGQGTLFREWEAQGLLAETVLVAVGGGGLIGGAVAWMGTRRRIVAVEPVNAPTLNRALVDGPESEVAVSGVAASALGSSRIGRIGYDLCRAGGVVSVLVSDEAILAAQRILWHELRQWVEPGGATALAALLSGAYRPAPGEQVAVLLCGANPAPDPAA